MRACARKCEEVEPCTPENAQTSVDTVTAPLQRERERDSGRDDVVGVGVIEIWM
jgi:hypothetical protein